jgi:hypothetical protein
MSKLYPARVRVAVGVVARPALLRFWTESAPAAQHLRRGRSPWYGPIRYWFFPIGSRFGVGVDRRQPLTRGAILRTVRPFN